jgi:hypothetical protein
LLDALSVTKREVFLSRILGGQAVLGACGWTRAANVRVSQVLKHYTLVLEIFK